MQQLKEAVGTYLFIKMFHEDNKNVLYGRGLNPGETIPQDALGMIIYNNLCKEDYVKQQPVMIDAFTGKSMSNQTLLEKSCLLAQALRKLGCDSETIISPCGENSLDFFIPVLATLFVGSIVAPINYLYSHDELKHSLTLTQSRVVFVTKIVAEKFVAVKEELKFIEKVIVFNSEDEFFKLQNLKEFIHEQLGNNALHYKDFVPWNGDTLKVATIPFSSGTTGIPKGVMLTHKNYAYRIVQTLDPLQGIPPSETITGLSPFFHAYGLNVGLTSILNRNRTVLFHKFDENVYLSAIEKYRINILTIVPTIAIFLAKSPKIDNYDLSSVNSVLCGSAPLSIEIEKVLKKRLNLFNVFQGWGQTETLPMTFLKKNDNTMGSCGTVVPFAALKIMDPQTGKSLGPYEVGEVCSKSPTIMKGYYKNEKITKESFTPDGWLKSGDLGYYDKDGHLFLVGRSKELIKYKGFQVPPAELEALLNSHPKVIESGVVGLPDELAGELPVAFIVKRTPDVTEAELQSFVSSKVSPQKRLRGGVIFVEALPKNTMGKILKSKLKLMLKNHVVKTEDSKL